jgi:hypothetical protein
MSIALAASTLGSAAVTRSALAITIIDMINDIISFMY